MFHILTPFPELLNYAFFAPLILRVVLGLYTLAFGFSAKNTTEETNIHKDVNYAIRGLLVIAGVFVIAGFYVQVATMVLAFLFVVALVKPHWIVTNEIGRAELVLLISISLTLMLLGAGAYAIDYPL